MSSDSPSSSLSGRSVGSADARVDVMVMKVVAVTILMLHALDFAAGGAETDVDTGGLYPAVGGVG